MIATIYFVFNKNQTLWNRMFASSHSLIAMVGALYAIVASKYTAPGSFDPHTVNFSKILAYCGNLWVCRGVIFQGK